MKKFKRALIPLFLILGFIIMPNTAKALTCEYLYDPGQAGIWRKVKVEIDSSYNYKAYLSTGNKPKNNPEPILNWEAGKKGTSFIVKDYIKQNNKCPEQALFYDKPGIFVSDWQVYLGDENTINKIQQSVDPSKSHSYICSPPEEKNDAYFEKINNQLLNRAKGLNDRYDRFFNQKCPEARLGVDSNKDCASLKTGILNEIKNNAIPDRDKAIADGLDPNSAGVRAINDFINKADSILVPTAVGEEVENLTCNYKATIDSKEVTLTVYKKRKLPGETQTIFNKTVTANNGYIIRYGEVYNLAAAQSKYDKLNNSVFGSVSVWQCLPEIAYDVNGTIIDLADKDMLDSLYNNKPWDKYFKLSSISARTSTGTTTHNVGTTPPKLLENATYQTTDVTKKWIFGGSNYDYNKDPSTPGDPNDPDVGSIEITEGCALIPEELKAWLNVALMLVRIGAVVGTAVLSMLDFVKAAASGEADEMKKVWKRLVNRLIIVALLFLVPVLLNFILDMAGLTDATGTCDIQ